MTTGTTAPAGKAPAKRTTAKAAPTKRTPKATSDRPVPHVPGATEPAEAPDPGVRTIEFHGHVVAVKMLTAEQLAVWQRTAARFGQLDAETMTTQEAGKVLDRGMKLLESLLADDASRDWLEDQLLDGTMKLPEAFGLIARTIEAFSGTQAPATGPAPKARRRR